MISAIIISLIGFFLVSGIFASFILYYNDEKNKGLDKIKKCSVSGFKYGPVAVIMFLFVNIKQLKIKLLNKS